MDRMRSKIYILTFLLLCLIGLDAQPPLKLGDVVVTCASYSPSNPTDTAAVIAIVSMQDWNTAHTPGRHWPAPMYQHPTWTRDDIGEVYGVTTDIDGNIYVTATSIYGEFPFDMNIPAGGIWKIDAQTYEPTLIASLPNAKGDFVTYDITSANNNDLDTISMQPALGNITYNPWHDQLYVTNFEDGKIYRLSTDGTILGTFDPLTPDDGLPGAAPLGERTWGISVAGDSPDNVELFYSVWAEDSGRSNMSVDNTIRSVKLDANGDFLSNTDSLIITIPRIFFAHRFTSPVADISISADGTRMLLAQKTMEADGFSFNNSSGSPRFAHRSTVLEYTRPNTNVRTWTPEPLRKYGLGSFGALKQNSIGGVTWGYDSVGVAGGRDTVYGLENQMWALTDLFRGEFVNPDMTITNKFLYGIEGQTTDIGRTMPTPESTHLYIDLDNAPSGGTEKALYGDIEAFTRFAQYRGLPIAAIVGGKVIPALGEWGVIIAALLLVIVGVLAVRVFTLGDILRD